MNKMLKLALIPLKLENIMDMMIMVMIIPQAAFLMAMAECILSLSSSDFKDALNESINKKRNNPVAIKLIIKLSVNSIPNKRTIIATVK